MSTLNPRDGLEPRAGTVSAGNPVHFHEHNHGHWLTCCDNIIDVETELQGRVRMLPGQMRWVEARDRHKLTAPAGPAKYTCVGREGL